MRWPATANLAASERRDFGTVALPAARARARALDGRAASRGPEARARLADVEIVPACRARLADVPGRPFKRTRSPVI